MHLKVALMIITSPDYMFPIYEIDHVCLQCILNGKTTVLMANA